MQSARPELTHNFTYWIQDLTLRHGVGTSMPLKLVRLFSQASKAFVPARLRI